MFNKASVIQQWLHRTCIGRVARERTESFEKSKVKPNSNLRPHKASCRAAAVILGDVARTGSLISESANSLLGLLKNVCRRTCLVGEGLISSSILMTSTISDAGSAMAFDLGMGLVVGTSITELELQMSYPELTNGVVGPGS